MYDKVKKSGRYWTGTPKRGALVLWRYGNNGHAAIAHDAGDRIDTTNPDPDNASGTATDVEGIGYPAKWGATQAARIWTDQYNNVRFPVGDEEDDMPSADEIAKAVWDQEVEDPVSGDTTSMRQLVKRIRTVTQQDKDADT